MRSSLARCVRSDDAFIAGVRVFFILLSFSFLGILVWCGKK